MSTPAKREYDRQYREANREKRRQWDRDAAARAKATGKHGRCACGAALSKQNTTGACVKCSDQAAADVATAVVARWVDGATYPEIRQMLGWSPNSNLAIYFNRLREAGYPVPRRAPGGRGWIDPLPSEPIVIQPGWSVAYGSRYAA